MILRIVLDRFFEEFYGRLSGFAKIVLERNKTSKNSLIKSEKIKLQNSTKLDKVFYI